MDCREGGTEYGRFTMADGPGKESTRTTRPTSWSGTGPCSSPPTPWPGTGASTRPPSPRSASPRTAAAPASPIREDGLWFEDSDGPADEKGARHPGWLLRRPAVSPHPGTSPMTDDDIGPTDLLLERHLPAPPETVYRCWTEPDLIKRFFSAPAPGPRARGGGGALAGGAFHVVMEFRRGTAAWRGARPGCVLIAEPARRFAWHRTRWDPGSGPNAESFFCRRHHLHGSGRRLRFPRDRHGPRLQGGRGAANEGMGFSHGWGTGGRIKLGFGWPRRSEACKLSAQWPDFKIRPDSGGAAL